MTESNVRDHLANERTFLAWVRTALGMIGLGFVLARMGLFLRQLAVTAAAAGLTGNGGTRPNLTKGLHAGHEFIISGVVFLAVGTALGVWSALLYDQNRRSIDANHFTPAVRSVRVLTSVVVFGSLAIIGLVVWRMVMEE